MESFKLFRKHLAMSGINTHQSPQNLHPFNLKNSVVIALASLHLISIAKLLDGANTIDQYTAIVYRLNYVQSFCIFYLNIVWRTSELVELVNRLEDSIQKKIALHSELKPLYTETSHQIQKWIKALHFYLIFVVPALFTLPSFIVSYYRYFTTDLGGDAFEFANPMWFPFHTKNPIGFSVACVIQCLSFTNLMMIVKCVNLIGISTMPMVFSLIDDIKHDLKTIQKSLRHKGMRSEMAKPLSQFVQFHSDTRQLTRDFSKILQIILMLNSSNAFIGICGELLLIEVSHQNSNANPTEMIALFFNCFSSFFALFVYCELGQRVRIAFEDIKIVLDELKWYLLPCKTRKMLPIILIVAQKPVEFDIYGSISCNRTTFKEVCHKVYSSFMVLRRFYD